MPKNELMHIEEAPWAWLTAGLTIDRVGMVVDGKHVTVELAEPLTVTEPGWYEFDPGMRRLEYRGDA